MTNIGNVGLAWWYGCANADLSLGLLRYALACKDVIWHGLKSDLRLSDRVRILEEPLQYHQETLRKLQLVELEVLLAIDAVCEEHGITYFLDSGTALGAKRHGGFIPWDDDIDIGMPRKDYDRFLDVAPAALGDGFTVANPESDDRLAGLFAKVWKNGTKFFTDETLDAGVDQGVFVDVFPYDRVASDAVARNAQLRSCLKWQSLSYLYHSKTINVPHKGLLGSMEIGACRIAHAFLKACSSSKKIRDKFTASALSAQDDRSSHDLACMNYTRQGVFAEGVLLPPKPLEFEGHESPAPANIEGYLCTLYGDTWNQLPPEEQRRNHAPKVLDLGN